MYHSVRPMELTNYWWLLIWILAAGALFLFLRPERPESVMGRTEMRWGWVPAIILMLPFFLWAGFRYNVGDTGLYRYLYLNMPTNPANWGGYLQEVNKDWGFSVLGLLIRSVAGDRYEIYFLIIAGFQSFALIRVFRKYSSDYWLSLFLFVISTDYISWMMNGMRQFTAVVFIFAFTDWIVQKKNIRMILVILLAATLHASALLMIPVLLIIQRKAWNILTIAMIIGTVTALVFINQLTDVLRDVLSDTQYAGVISNWEEWDDNGTNPIRVLVYSIPLIIAIIGNRYVREADDPFVNVCVNAAVVTTSLYLISMVTSGIYIGRLPIYVSLYSTCILLPWEIDHMFTKRSANIIKVFAVLFYIGFFYYQMHYAWSLL